MRGIFLAKAMKTKLGSRSVKNFAVGHLCKIFSPKALVNRNCRESQEKEASDANKFGSIKVYCFKLHPTTLGCKEQQWGKCIIAIEELIIT